ncbi:MAG: glycosyltransferase [Proteobacteria bacterium]|nr:glycosyltransferase [Pseudomonadota bacterium]
MKITAILVVRNEKDYIEATLRSLIDDGIDIAIIDNASTDSTESICRKYHPEHVKKIVSIPFHGTFDLRQHIEAGVKLLGELDTDWVISHAADERFSSDIPGERLCDAIARVDALGCNVINADEFVFVYENDAVDYRGTDFCEKMRHYYFFEPFPYRLMRIFKKGVPLDGILAGVHQMGGSGIRLHRENFTLRHYPVLGHAHAKEKYLSRRYNAQEIEMGWHRNRTIMTADNLKAPDMRLLQWRQHDATPLAKTSPRTTHFWEW